MTYHGTTYTFHYDLPSYNPRSTRTYHGTTYTFYYDTYYGTTHTFH